MSLDGLRQWAHSHPVAFIIPMVLLVVAAVAVGFRSSQGPVPVPYDLKLYFYDEDTEETVIHTDKDIPPLIGHGGKASVVQAIYMTASGSTDKTLVYLLKYTDEAKAGLDEAVRKKGVLDALTARGYAGGCLVRKPAKGSPWVSIMSAEGQAIVSSFQTEHGNETVRPANP